MSPADEAAAVANGQPLVNADRFGGATRSLAHTALNAEPNVKAELSEFTNDRFLKQNARAEDWIKRNTGAPTDLYTVQQNLGGAAKGVNNATYKTAYSQPAAKAIWTPEIEQLMESENFRKAAKAAIKSSNEEAALTGGKPIADPFVIDSKTGSYRLRTDANGNAIQPSLEFWDHVQRQLRQKAAKLARQGKNFDAGQVYRARQQLNDVLDTTVPEFAVARGGAARWFGAEDALEAGQKFATSKAVDMGEARAAHANFTPTEKKLFASGLAAALIGKIKDTPYTSNVISNVFGSPQAREMIEMGMGARAAAELESFVRVEDAMQLLKRLASSGQEGISLQQLAQIAGIGVSHTGAGYGVGATIGGGGWDPRNWGTKAWTIAAITTAGRAGARHVGKKVDQAVMHQIAKLLASNDPALIQKAVQNASRSDRAAAAVKAIEEGMALLTRGAGMGAGAGAETATEEPAQ